MGRQMIYELKNVLLVACLLYFVWEFGRFLVALLQRWYAYTVSGDSFPGSSTGGDGQSWPRAKALPTSGARR